MSIYMDQLGRSLQHQSSQHNYHCITRFYGHYRYCLFCTFICKLLCTDHGLVCFGTLLYLLAICIYCHRRSRWCYKYSHIQFRTCPWSCVSCLPNLRHENISCMNFHSLQVLYFFLYSHMSVSICLQYHNHHSQNNPQIYDYNP